MTITTPDTYKYNLMAKKIAMPVIIYKTRDQRDRYLRKADGKKTYEKLSLEKNGVLSPKQYIDLNPEIEPRKSAPYLMGLELEIEHQKKSIRDMDLTPLIEALKPFSGEQYACTDGSLSNGIELVFAPRTVSEWAHRYDKIYKLLKSLSKMGFFSHESGRCGLHFHVSKTAMSSDRWIKLITFVNRNKQFFTKVSRRGGPNSYCKYVYSRTDRYCAINTTNPDTYEFRMFRGTLLPDSFLSSLEIVFSVVDFFRSEVKRPGIVAYKKFLNNNPKWKHASKYCAPHFPTPQERKLLSDQEKQARKLLKESRERVNAQNAQNYITDRVSGARNQLYNAIGRNYIIDGTTMRQYFLPLKFIGSHPRIYRKYLESCTAIVPVLLPSNLHPSQIAQLKSDGISCRRKSGWGRTRYYYSSPAIRAPRFGYSSDSAILVTQSINNMTF